MKTMLLATSLLLGVVAQAHAATETIDYTFTVSGIGPEGLGPAAPQTSVPGGFEVTYDPTVSGPVTVDSINLTINGHNYLTSDVGASYNAGTNQLLVGGTIGGATAFPQTGQYDFAIYFPPGGSFFSALTLAYTDPGYPNTVFEGDVFEGLGPFSAQVVPQPNSLFLLLCGGAALLVFARRSRDTPKAGQHGVLAG